MNLLDKIVMASKYDTENDDLKIQKINFYINDKATRDFQNKISHNYENFKFRNELTNNTNKTWILKNNEYNSKFKKDKYELINYQFFILKLFPENMIFKYLKKNDEYYKNNRFSGLQEEIEGVLNVNEYSNFEINDLLNFQFLLNKLVFMYLDSKFAQEFYLLEYKINDSKISPTKNDNPYSQFEDLLPQELKYYMEIKTDNYQIIHCQSQDEYKYSIKRLSIPFDAFLFNEKENKLDLNENIIKEYEKVFKFIENNYKNYFYSSLIKEIYQFPFVPFIYGLKMTLLINQNLLVIEFLYQYFGKPCSEYHNFKFGHPKFLENFLCNLLGIQYLLESSCIKYEFFPERISLIDQENMEIIYYFIDLCIFPMDNNNVPKVNSIYDAPEIQHNLNANNSSLPGNNETDCSKSQIYLIGVMLLERLGFFNGYYNKTKFIESKKSRKENIQFEESLNKFLKRNIDRQIRKLIMIVEHCLEYDVNERISATEIFLFMNSLENIKEEKKISEGFERILMETKHALFKLKCYLFAVQNKEAFYFFRNWIQKVLIMH